MQAVILAAGLGTRMGEMIRDTPKPLLKIGEETILEHNLKALPQETDEVILVVGYLGEKIREKIGEKYVSTSPPTPPLARGGGKAREFKITYVEQKELKGTAHALWQCKDLLRNKFLVLMGDDFYDRGDLEKLVEYNLAILGWELKEDQSKEDRQAVIKIDEEGNLLDIIERQPATKGSLVNAGAYVLNTALFNYPMVPAGKPANEYGLPQTFMQMVKDGAKFSVVKAKRWHKVASPSDLKIT
ncbi:MAG: nucleotidyltransferase family protein [Candidatus Doudnabacteria bacterium]|nr:nucleotidyltransferase family protein [Candidatus Doudnabacteria bacterium]